MSGPEVAKTPGGGAPGKEGKEPVANGHAGDSNDANPFAEYMWMENEEEYNRQVGRKKSCFLLFANSNASTDRFLCLATALPGGGGAAGAGVLGALLPGNAGGGGPGLVHPVARPQQPGGGPAAAAAQWAVSQRPPQQPGGSGGEWRERRPERSTAHLPMWLIPLSLAEEERLESRSKGVRPREEILGVPLTPMEPPHAHAEQSSHILKDSGGLEPRTQILTNTHTHLYTLEM